ncbi:MAG TPA: hypothetical protein VF027_00255 [Sphingomicrobium sp.]
MRHLLMDPRFPDIVGEAARQRDECADRSGSAHDNDDGVNGSELSDPLFAKRAELEVAATRLW